MYVGDDDVVEGRAVVIAPQGFLEAAISENVLAGTVMIRRAMYMYGALLPKDAQGHVDTGLGKGLPALPSVALIAPTHEVTATGEELVMDGVRLVFQMTPGTEAPAEMNIFVPEERALCMAENCTANQHNVYTLRGAQVRDALMWSKYIDQSLELYAHQCDVLFASHHWPRWGQADLSAYLASQRDAYRYVHDQTLRLANHGRTMNEIAEELVLPAGLGDEFFNRGYYGTLSHNAKAVYQRYLGWFDGNPAHLNPHPPVEAATRYVAFMGGADAVLEKARASFAQGDYRWVVEVVNHVVFADPENEPARLLQADALEQLGFQSESGPWRDFYLSGAMELRSNGTVLKGVTGNALGAGHRALDDAGTAARSHRRAAQWSAVGAVRSRGRARHRGPRRRTLEFRCAPRCLARAPRRAQALARSASSAPSRPSRSSRPAPKTSTSCSPARTSR